MWLFFPPALVLLSKFDSVNSKKQRERKEKYIGAKDISLYTHTQRHIHTQRVICGAAPGDVKMPMATSALKGSCSALVPWCSSQSSPHLWEGSCWETPDSLELTEVELRYHEGLGLGKPLVPK